MDNQRDPPMERPYEPFELMLRLGRTKHTSCNDPGDGDSARYASLFVDMQADLIAYLRSQHLSQSDAEDALQETFLIVSERITSFDPSRDFGNWVRGIARNVALRQRRRYGKDKSQRLEGIEESLVQSVEPELDPSCMAISLKSGVRSWISRLGPEQQQMVLMRYVERREVDDIAARLGKSEAAVYMALSRIRTSLQSCIDKQRRLERTCTAQGPAAERELLAIELPPTAADAAVDTTTALRLLVSGDGTITVLRPPFAD